MAIFADLTVQENLSSPRATGRSDQTRLDWIFGLFPALKSFWHLPAGTSLGRAEADAGDRARHRRAAPAAADRRADQGPGARDHRQPDRGLPRAEATASATILLVEQNFAFARQLGDTVAVMDNGTRRASAAAMADLAADARLQQRLLGLSLDTHQ